MTRGAFRGCRAGKPSFARRPRQREIPDACHGFDGPVAVYDDPALVREGLVKSSAKHLHGEKAVVGGAADDATKLIHVSVEHDP